jgi:hypothetical protein
LEVSGYAYLYQSILYVVAIAGIVLQEKWLAKAEAKKAGNRD